MAELICPECKQEGFTWSYDDGSIPPTYWGCRYCGYGATEDESLERLCADCGKTEIQLVDGEKKYWWCTQCHKVILEV